MRCWSFEFRWTMGLRLHGRGPELPATGSPEACQGAKTHDNRERGPTLTSPRLRLQGQSLGERDLFCYFTGEGLVGEAFHAGPGGRLPAPRSVGDDSSSAHGGLRTSTRDTASPAGSHPSHCPQGLCGSSRGAPATAVHAGRPPRPMRPGGRRTRGPLLMTFVRLGSTGVCAAWHPTHMVTSNSEHFTRHNCRPAPAGSRPLGAMRLRAGGVGRRKWDGKLAFKP